MNVRGKLYATGGALLILVVACLPAPIIIRHDRPDIRHRALAARFPSVVHLNLLAVGAARLRREGDRGVVGRIGITADGRGDVAGGSP